MTQPTGTLISVNVGLPRLVSDPESTAPPRPSRTQGVPPNPSHESGSLWTTGFFKAPQLGPVAVHPTNLAGDGQADVRVHGGVDKAVLAYAADHFAAWREELAMPELPWGAFGENLSISALDETTVAIGDVWQIADTRLQVSQPRQPCWKLARRWHWPDLTRRVLQTGRSGWYYRVLQPGTIQAGQSVTLVDRPHPQWTIARCNDAMYRQTESRSALVELIGLPELSAAWKRDM